MRTFVLFFLLFLCSFSLHSQKINWHSPDQQIFEKWVLLQVNQLRDSLGLVPLELDPILAKAAQDQSDYQVAIQKVTHNQATLRKESPSRRVNFYEGTHSLVGENCAMQDARRYGKTYQRLARAFFLAWYHSPGHYANMVEPDYRTIGIRFATNLRNPRVYATQVFGGKPYVPPAGVSIPKDAFGVLDRNKRICKKIAPFRRTAEELAGYLQQKDDSIFIAFHDKKYLKRMLNHPNDGLAVDFVNRDQLPCDDVNVFHGSAVFDGVMLEPVFRYELFKNNRSTHPKRVLSFLGKMPKNLPPDHQVNLITIKENHACRYSYPIDVPTGNIEAFQLKPIWMLTKGKIKADSIAGEAIHTVMFEKNESTFERKEFQDLLRQIGDMLPFVDSIHIRAFSSVEGDSSINMRLQAERASKVKAYFVALGITDSLISYETAENWALFKEQIAKTEMAFLQNFDQQEIKKMLQDPTLARDLEYALAQQRKAEVYIQIAGVYDDKTPAKYLEPALTQVSADRDAKQSWIIQSRMIRYERYQSEFAAQKLLGKSFPDSLAFFPQISNQMQAMFAAYGDIQPHAIGKTIMGWPLHVQRWLKDSAVPPPMKFCLLQNQIIKLHRAPAFPDNIYFQPALPADSMLWHIEQLYLDTLGWDTTEVVDVENRLNRLMINFHLAATGYYYSQNEYEKKRKSLKAVRDYFLQSEVTEAEAHRLALYFNRHQYYDWAVEILEPWARKDDVNKDVLFDFVQTLMLISDELEDNDLPYFLEKLIKRDQARFCDWVNTYFQLKREAALKTVYCEICR